MILLSSAGCEHNNKRAITLLEIALTITISLVMINATAFYYGGALKKSKESALKQTLNETRKAIDAYYKHYGYYPEQLEDLVSGSYVYLRNYPVDPVSGHRAWLIIKENGHTAISTQPYTGPVYDIKSLLSDYYHY
jgi:type II secretory pathway pseudopilin PulG